MIQYFQLVRNKYSTSEKQSKNDQEKFSIIRYFHTGGEEVELTSPLYIEPNE